MSFWGPVVGAGIGAAASLLGGRSRSQTTTATAVPQPWPGQAGYLSDIYGQAQALGAQPVSPFSTEAINALAAQARDPASLVAQAQGQLGATLGGRYLDPASNPWLAGSVQLGLDQIRRNLSQQFAGDAFGSSAHREWLAQKMGQYALPIYAQNYAQERQNQLGALPLSMSLQPFNINQLAMAGQRADAARWAPLQQYAALVGNPFGAGGTTTTTSPYYTNPWASMFGGGLFGAQLGGEIARNWPPGWGGGGGIDYGGAPPMTPGGGA